MKISVDVIFGPVGIIFICNLFFYYVTSVLNEKRKWEKIAKSDPQKFSATSRK